MLAIDLAKNVFQLHGVDERGHPLLCKAVKRAKLTEVVQNLPPCRIVMEACGGAHYWARRFQVMGHAVQLIAAQFVKPFVKSHKNDRHDAEAIAEAAARPTMRYVPVKSVEQQDIQTLHRIRSLLMKDRVAQINQIRGLLAEYGLVIPQNAERVRQQLPSILEDGANALTPLTQELMRDLYERLVGLDERIARYDQHIQQLHQHSPISRKLDEVRGVGPLIATAVLAGVGDAKDFKNGRQFAAWLGLVPRQHSSGGKPPVTTVHPTLPTGDVHTTPHPYPMSEPLPSVAQAEAMTVTDDGTRVKDLMHRGIIACAPTDTVGHAAKIMVDHEIHAVVVMDAGQAVGVVSQTDMVLARQGRTPEEARAMLTKDIMTPGCATCDAEILLSEAVSLMTGRRMHRLVVTENGQPTGVLSMTDVVRKIIGD